jgi:hypothetical protein
MHQLQKKSQNSPSPYLLSSGLATPVSLIYFFRTTYLARPRVHMWSTLELSVGANVWFFLFDHIYKQRISNYSSQKHFCASLKNLTPWLDSNPDRRLFRGKRWPSFYSFWCSIRELVALRNNRTLVSCRRLERQFSVRMSWCFEGESQKLEKLVHKILFLEKPMEETFSM